MGREGDDGDDARRGRGGGEGRGGEAALGDGGEALGLAAEVGLVAARDAVEVDVGAG